MGVAWASGRMKQLGVQLALWVKCTPLKVKATRGNAGDSMALLISTDKFFRDFRAQQSNLGLTNAQVENALGWRSGTLTESVAKWEHARKRATQ